MFKGCAGSQGARRDEQDVAATPRNPQLVKHGSLIVRKESGLEDNLEDNALITSQQVCVLERQPGEWKGQTSSSRGFLGLRPAPGTG